MPEPALLPAVSTGIVFLYLGETVTGPVDVAQLPAMLSTGMITDGTPSSAAGTQDWKPVQEFL